MFLRVNINTHRRDHWPGGSCTRSPPAGVPPSKFTHHATEYQFVLLGRVTVQRAATQHGRRSNRTNFVVLRVDRIKLDFDTAGRERRCAAEGHFILHQRRSHAQAGERAGWRSLQTPGIGDIDEGLLAVVTDGNIQRAGDLDLALPFIPLISIAAVSLPDKRLGFTLEAGKQVLTAGIAGVHQAQQLILALLQFCGNRGAILAAQCAITGLHGQLPHTLQDSVGGVEANLFLGQAVFRGGEVFCVLVKDILLLLQLQQAYRGYRIIGRGQDPVARTDLLLSTGHIGIVALQAGNAVIECLQG